MGLSVEVQQAVPIVLQVKKFVVYGRDAGHRQTFVVTAEERFEHQQSRQPEQKM